MENRQRDIRRPPVPIFATKKPRTALLAHPNNLNSNGETFGTVYSGRLQTQPTNRHASSNIWQGHQGTHSLQHEYSVPVNQAPSWPHPPAEVKRMPWQQQQQPYHQANQMEPAPTVWNNAPQEANYSNSSEWAQEAQKPQRPNFDSQLPHQPPGHWQSGPTYNYSPDIREAQVYQGPQRQQVQYDNQNHRGDQQRHNAQRNSADYMRKSNTGNGPKQQKQSTITHLEQQNLRDYGFNSLQDSRQGTSSTFTPRYGQAPGGNRSLSVQQNTPTPGQQPWGMASIPKDSPSPSIPSVPAKATNAEDEIIATPAPDTSLKVLSATVQGMQHWSRHKEKAPLMFELNGQVDSAVGTDPKSGHRVFMLKDDKNYTVQCVFFEIDRAFPRLVRGQHYRCVGTYEPGNARLRCVSVRAATEVERQLHRACVAASDRAMRNWTSSLCES